MKLTKSKISNFKKILSFFLKKLDPPKNLDAPKNRLVHPELWACHFERFRDLAIFPKFQKTLTFGVSLVHGTLPPQSPSVKTGGLSPSTIQNGIPFRLFAWQVHRFFFICGGAAA